MASVFFKMTEGLQTVCGNVESIFRKIVLAKNIVVATRLNADSVAVFAENIVQKLVSACAFHKNAHCVLAKNIVFDVAV